MTREFSAIVIGLAVLILPGSITTAQSSRQVQKRTQVKVYFYHDPGEHIDLSPVTRSVNAASPARGAIEALLKGPTRAEERRGFGPLASASEFTIKSLTISDGTARIDFVPSKKWLGWPGDLGPVRFKVAVELTLKQFPNVRTVIVSLNGDPKFADES